MKIRKSCSLERHYCVYFPEPDYTDIDNALSEMIEKAAEKLFFDEEIEYCDDITMRLYFGEKCAAEYNITCTARPDFRVKKIEC